MVISNLFINSVLYGQDSSFFRINFNVFSTVIGRLSTNYNGDLSIGSKFIVESNRKRVLGFEVIEFESIFFNKIGIKTGIGLYSSSLDQNRFKNEFVSIFPNYEVYIPLADYDNGKVPILGEFTPITLDLGLVGFFPIKDFMLTPSFTYKPSLTSDDYKVYANYINKVSGETFTRHYNLTEHKHYGYCATLDIRYVLDDALYFGVRAEYMQLKSRGIASYRDNYPTYDVQGENSEYQRTSSIFMIGINLGFTILKK